MPIMHVFLVEGRRPEVKEAFIAAVTEAAVRTIGVKPESVRVMITDMPKANFGIGGRSVASRSSDS